MGHKNTNFPLQLSMIASVGPLPSLHPVPCLFDLSHRRLTTLKVQTLKIRTIHEKRFEAGLLARHSHVFIPRDHDNRVSASIDSLRTLRESRVHNLSQSILGIFQTPVHLKVPSSQH